MTNPDCHVGTEVAVVVSLEVQEVVGDYTETVYQTPLEVAWTLAIAAPFVFAFPSLVADPSAASQVTGGPYVAFPPNDCTCEQNGFHVVVVDNSMQLISQN